MFSVIDRLMMLFLGRNWYSFSSLMNLGLVSYFWCLMIMWCVSGNVLLKVVMFRLRKFRNNFLVVGMGCLVVRRLGVFIIILCKCGVIVVCMKGYV